MFRTLHVMYTSIVYVFQSLVFFLDAYQLTLTYISCSSDLPLMGIFPFRVETSFELT